MPLWLSFIIPYRPMQYVCRPNNGVHDEPSPPLTGAEVDGAAAAACCACGAGVPWATAAVCGRRLFSHCWPAVVHGADVDRQLAVVPSDDLCVPAADQDKKRPEGLAPVPQQHGSSCQHALLLAGGSVAWRVKDSEVAAAPLFRRPHAAMYQQAVRGNQHTA